MSGIFLNQKFLKCIVKNRLVFNHQISIGFVFTLIAITRELSNNFKFLNLKLTLKEFKACRTCSNPFSVMISWMLSFFPLMFKFVITFLTFLPITKNKVS